jgi:two-component system phosphate regulon sensor histidine kinase PhoR
MTFALLGLIMVQYRWIQNAIKVERKKFDLLVEKSLSEVVQKIAEHETVLNMYDETVSFSTKNSNQTSDNYKRKLFDSSSQIIDKPLFYVATKDSSYYKLKEDVKSLDTIENEKLISKEEIRAGLLEKITDKSIFVENIVNKLIRREIKLDERIDKKTLELIVKAVFKNNNIELEHEYAVIKENDKEFFKSAGFDLSGNPKTYSKLLFSEDLLANDIIPDKYSLKIYFPKSNQSFESLPSIIFTSVALTLVILVIFIITLYIIFRQKKLSEIKNDFINNMTHELKTPISTISLASQMLRDNSLAENQMNFQHISGIIADESKRLGFHVEKVLQMAILDKGGVDLSCKQINVHDILNHILNTINFNLKEKNGELKSELLAQKDLVFADEMHLSNVFSNLLDNAIKYSKNSPFIEIKTRNLNGHIIVSFKDNGIGIRKENHKKVFEKFYRVPTGNLHDVRGFGLGLSYVKKIVEQHKGYVNLISENGLGSEFEVYIPLLK